MQKFSRSEILATYDQHPLREKTILARILKQNGSLDRLTQRELAEDSLTEITDQNHVGGVPFVKELAEKADVNSNSRVLDLGCGLGGSARYLAYLFGCKVHGIDFSENRCRDAQSLTKLVGLENLVTFECGDVLEMELPERKVDILWGQSAWVHVRDKQGFIKRWSQMLDRGGRIALEDAYLKAPPRTEAQKNELTTLENIWMSYLITREEWAEIFTAESFSVRVKQDLSSGLVEYFSKLLDVAACDENKQIPQTEITAWKHAVRLAKEGVLGYFRMIAWKSS